MIKYIIIALVALMSSCANYTVGDPSIKYCQAATPELRQAMRNVLESHGVVLSVDYCATVGLIDLMVDTQEPKG